MYLAKVHIVPGKSHNAYELHRALWELFPGQSESTRGFLFRVEKQNRMAGAEVLLQSDVEPIAQANSARRLACKPLSFALSEGQILRFRVRCNPVKSIKDKRRGTVTRNGTTYTRSVRVPIIDEDEQCQWLKKKFKGVGALLQGVNIIQESPLYFRKHKEKRSGKIQPVLFEGMLRVQSADLFIEEALKKGVGPAKSFGMGLVSLAAI